MIKRLQKKWKVGGWRLLLILITFAVGGSLTGLAGRKIMILSGIENKFLYLPLYIIIVTLIWPLMVILVSIPLGQFHFFIAYIGQLIKRLKRSKTI